MFEAGIGHGVLATVMPVLVRNFNKLEFPLGGFHAPLIDDASGILDAIAKKLNRSPSKSPSTEESAEYLHEIRRAETNVVYKDIQIKPHLKGNELLFGIKNGGNTDIELLMFEVWIPRQYLSPAPPADPREVTRKFAHCELGSDKNGEHVWLACTSRRGVFGDKLPALRPVLTPTMGSTTITELAIRLILDQPSTDGPEPPIRYQMQAIDHRTEEQLVTLSALLAAARSASPIH